MAQPNKPASKTETIVVGAIAAAAGFYFALVGAGLLPVPGGTRDLHAPLWILLCAGLAFLMGGLAVVHGALLRNEGTPAGELPPNAPRWSHRTQICSACSPPDAWGPSPHGSHSALARAHSI